MAKVVPLQNTFDRMIRDVSRDRLPRGACWDIQDMIPNELGAPLAKRGGWEYASGALTGVLAGADFVTALIYAPFSGGDQIVAVVRDAGAPATRLAQVSPSDGSSTDRGDLGSTFVPGGNPAFYRDKVYLGNATASGNVKVYGGSTDVANYTANGGGTNILGNQVFVYKDHLCHTSNVPAGLERLWFADAGDPTSLDANAFLDTSAPITAAYPLRNSIIIFHQGFSERIIGSIPPPGTDMYLQTLTDLGCDQPFSLAGTDQFVVFANASGVYMTDGSEPIDLTQQGGIKSYWQEQYKTATIPGVAGGYGRGWYFCTIRDRSGPTFKDAFMCHLASRRWVRVSNLTATSFARRLSGKEELYFGDFSEPRVNSLFSFFTPGSSVRDDGDGTAVPLVLETPFYLLGQSKGRVKSFYITHHFHDHDSENPSITVSATHDVHDPQYTSLGTISPADEHMVYERLDVSSSGYGIGFKIVQTGASSETGIFSLGIDAHPREDSRLD